MVERSQSRVLHILATYKVSALAITCCEKKLLRLHCGCPKAEHTHIKKVFDHIPSSQTTGVRPLKGGVLLEEEIAEMDLGV